MFATFLETPRIRLSHTNESGVNELNGVFHQFAKYEI